jgi:hypothetical protein
LADENFAENFELYVEIKIKLTLLSVGKNTILSGKLLSANYKTDLLQFKIRLSNKGYDVGTITVYLVLIGLMHYYLL